MQLYEKHRPTSFDDVVGQDKALAKLARLRKRGLGGNSFFWTGQYGTGKTTIARLIAAEVADDWATVEFSDPSELTAEVIRKIRDDYRYRPLGRGSAIIVNEIHGATKTQVRLLLGLTENAPEWVTWIFTMPITGQQALFENVEDSHPLLARCIELPLARRDLTTVFAQRAMDIARAENLDGQPLSEYVKLLKRCKNDLRKAIGCIAAGEMLDE